MIIHCLKIIGDLAENVLNEGTQTKRLCHECIRDYIDIAHALFPIYVNDVAVCEELFAFFHIVLDVLKTQVIKSSMTLCIYLHSHVILLRHFLPLMDVIRKHRESDRLKHNCIDWKNKGVNT